MKEKTAEKARQTAEDFLKDCNDHFGHDEADWGFVESLAELWRQVCKKQAEEKDKEIEKWGQANKNIAYNNLKLESQLSSIRGEINDICIATSNLIPNHNSEQTEVIVKTNAIVEIHNRLVNIFESLKQSAGGE